ncbi:beta-N-acetylhexosaminidase [Rugosimonospora africana]|uniref:beta-N-acetylhexosaminidase n=1 Tax=Rugosimonospora africana TaxID=556532 RepID=A0A8J3R2P9_9ACTN|nr:beta-N-acetylhexosaminidase [Rugosimonospora africana]GIH19086.1 beta-N-acetylhexosaminidase [Rugosimonospora africana]
MYARPIVPKPISLSARDGAFTLTENTPLHAPEALADLVRELLGPATGFRFAPGSGGIELDVIDDSTLGAEGYRLVVTPDGVRAAGTEAGLRWAVQTLRQLLPAEIFAGAAVPDANWEIPCVEIVDVPRYEWRGGLLDVARWCHPIEFVYKYVDLLALHKLNRLHLHLTDDQGWRFEVKRHPKLTEVGAWRTESNAGHAREGRFDATPHGGWYTQQELRDLVGYAARRGVSVMPEIDVPGHMQAAIAAYPWLGNNPDRQLGVRTSWGISQHILNVDDATVDFVSEVLDEVVDVFPFEYVHLGGDEVPPDEWLASEAARRRAEQAGLSRVDGLVGWWAGRLAAHLAKRGRHIGVWDELLDRNPPAGSLVFAWQDSSRVAAAQEAGFRVVAVPQEYAYLDWAESDSPSEPLAIRGTLPLSTAYGYQPGDVYGVQGQLWSEYLPTPDLVEYRAFPRLAAFAEIGWSAPEPRDLAEFTGRLSGHLRRLDALNVRYRPLD